MKRFSRKERNGAIAVFLTAVALTVAGFCVRNRIVPASAPVAGERIIFQADSVAPETSDCETDKRDSHTRRSRSKKREKNKKSNQSRKSRSDKKSTAPAAPPRDFLNEPIATGPSSE